MNEQILHLIQMYLKYQIDAISSARDEVRLKAKKVNGSYTDQFIDMQTSIKALDVINPIQFHVEDVTCAEGREWVHLHLPHSHCSSARWLSA